MMVVNYLYSAHPRAKGSGGAYPTNWLIQKSMQWFLGERRGEGQAREQARQEFRVVHWGQCPGLLEASLGSSLALSC